MKEKITFEQFLGTVETEYQLVCRGFAQLLDGQRLQSDIRGKEERLSRVLQVRKAAKSDCEFCVPQGWDVSANLWRTHRRVQRFLEHAAHRDGEVNRECLTLQTTRSRWLQPQVPRL